MTIKRHLVQVKLDRRSGINRSIIGGDSFRQSRVDTEASTFHFGKERMNKLTVWRLFDD